MLNMKRYFLRIKNTQLINSTCAHYVVLKVTGFFSPWTVFILDIFTINLMASVESRKLLSKYVCVSSYRLITLCYGMQIRLQTVFSDWNGFVLIGCSPQLIIEMLLQVTIVYANILRCKLCTKCFHTFSVSYYVPDFT